MFIPESWKSSLDCVLPGKSMWRSLAKSITWRILASTDTFLAGYFILPFLLPLFGFEPVEPNVAFAGGIALFEIVSKLLLYFFHERAWARVGNPRYPKTKKAVQKRRKLTGRKIAKLTKVRA